MPNAKDLSGQKFGRLTVLKYMFSQEVGTKGKTVRMHLCKCECGNVILADTGSLTTGNTKSCGCLNKDHAKDLRNKGLRYTHGFSHTRLGHCYYSAKRRCKSNPNWVKKGIKMCEEWDMNPQSFFEWAIENGYEDNLTLDRIDPYGNYEPANCRWVSKAAQANNKTNTRYATIGGITKSLADWSRISGVSIPTLIKRIERNAPEEELLVPVGAVYHTKDRHRTSYRHELTIHGETHSISEWAMRFNLKPSTLLARVNRNWPEEELGLPVGSISHLGKPIKLTINGETHTVKEWGEISGLKTHTLYERLDGHWPETDLLRPPEKRVFLGRIAKAISEKSEELVNRKWVEDQF